MHLVFLQISPHSGINKRIVYTNQKPFPKQTSGLVIGQNLASLTRLSQTISDLALGLINNESLPLYLPKGSHWLLTPTSTNSICPTSFLLAIAGQIFPFCRRAWLGV